MNNLFRTSKYETKEKKQGKFKEKKEQTITSLLEVENFLNQTKKALNHIKLYKILK